MLLGSPVTSTLTLMADGRRNYQNKFSSNLFNGAEPDESQSKRKLSPSAGPAGGPPVAPPARPHDSSGTGLGEDRTDAERAVSAVGSGRRVKAGGLEAHPTAENGLWI